ncbi:MAG: hypothetical protein K9H62_02700 [Bacteroidales bacterium]|nr:hypothetical protein [Bacteroidales bacterium]
MLFVAFFATAPLCSQTGISNIRFENLDVSYGLSNNTVNEILQDKYGFIWLATDDGLNRYDGYDIEVFRYNPNDSLSIGGNYFNARRIVKCKNGDILAHPNNSLDSYYFYDFISGFIPWHKYLNFSIFDKIEYRDSLNSNLLLDFYFDKPNDLLYIVDQNGFYDHPFFLRDLNKNFILTGNSLLTLLYNDLFIINLDTKLVEKQKSFPEDVSFFYNIDTTSFWIRGTTDLFQYNLESGETRVVVDNLSSYCLPYQDSHNRLWVVTQEEDAPTNIVIINPKGFAKTIDLSGYGSGNDFRINALSPIDGELWASSTNNGYLVFNQNDSIIGHIVRDGANPNSLPDNSVRKIFADKDKNLWVPTEQNGVGLSVPNRFTNITTKTKSPYRLGSNDVHGMYFDSKSNTLWAGSHGDGISQIDLSGNKSSLHLQEYGLDLQVATIFVESDSTLLIGSFYKGIHNGISRYNYRSKHLQTLYSIKAQGLNDLYIRTIIRDSKGNIWFCSMGALIKMDSQGIFTEHYLSDSTNDNNCNLIFTIIESVDGTYFVGTEAGIINFNQSYSILKEYDCERGVENKLTNKTIFCLYEDESGNLWAGTFGGGLQKIDLKTDSIKSYNSSHGLCNDAIYGIIEDSNGLLWLSTNNGLSCFDPLKETFRNFSTKDGLVYDAFNFGAYCADTNGNIYMGTHEGLTWFHPDSALKTKPVGQIVIKKIEIHGTGRTYNFPDSTETIEIAYLTENLLSVDYVCPEFANTDNIHYSYRIDDLSDDWIDLGHQLQLVLSGLPYGIHKIKFKATKVPDEWNSSFTSITIFIKPPFWDTLWFRLGVVAIVLFIFLAILWNRDRNTKRVSALRTQLAHDLHDEIGSNISSINLIGQRMIRYNEKDEKTEKLPGDIVLLSNRTIESMRDIIWFMKPENDSTEKIRIRLIDYIARTLGELDYELNLDAEFFQRDVAPGIIRNVFLIIKELVNNIAKHAQASQAKVIVKRSGNKVHIVVSDNGKGLEKLHEGTGMSSLRKRTKEIGGTLNIDTKPGQGTTISLHTTI